MEQDIRWLQRYDSYCKACKRVLLVTESERKPYELTELEMEGRIADGNAYRFGHSSNSFNA